MTLEEQLLEWLKEAAKVMHMDQSHDSLRSKLQNHLMTQHRANNPDAGYYDYPTVVDTYGDGTSGQVVYSKSGKLTMADYKHNPRTDSHELSKHKTVKRAYAVVNDNDADDKVRESLTILYDGGEHTISLKEADVTIADEITYFRESKSFINNEGCGRLKLISPGKGAHGYYSADVLKEAAKNKVFPAGTKMFLDHPTMDEEMQRPERSLRAMAAKFTSDAVFEESGADGPGLYADYKAYQDYIPFLKERAADIGTSINAGGLKDGTKTVDGVPVVKKLVVARSVDFVTVAGRGGKLLPLYESFRESNPGVIPPIGDDMALTQIDESVLATLRESAALVTKLQVQMSRQSDQLAKICARGIADTLLKESRLPGRAQVRVLGTLINDTSEVPLTEAGGLDETKFRAAVKKAVEDEATYLRESGAGFHVILPGGNDTGTEGETDPAQNDATMLKEADGEITKLISNMAGNAPAGKEKQS